MSCFLFVPDMCVRVCQCVRACVPVCVHVCAYPCACVRAGAGAYPWELPAQHSVSLCVWVLLTVKVTSANSRACSAAIGQDAPVPQMPPSCCPLEPPTPPCLQPAPSSMSLRGSCGQWPWSGASLTGCTSLLPVAGPRSTPVLTEGHLGGFLV